MHISWPIRRGAAAAPGSRVHEFGKINILNLKKYIFSAEQILNYWDIQTGNSINVKFALSVTAAIVIAPLRKPSYATVNIHTLTQQKNLLVPVALISERQRNVDSWKSNMFTCVMMTDRITKFVIIWCVRWTFFLAALWSTNRAVSFTSHCRWRP